MDRPVNIPDAIINRLKHYFLTYKNLPVDKVRIIEIVNVFGKEEAHEIIMKSMTDYQLKFDSPVINKVV